MGRAGKSSIGRGLLTIAVPLYLIATTISFASTTLASRSFIEPMRLLAFGAALGAACLVLLLRMRLARTAVVGASVYLSALCYGAILALANGGMVHVAEQIHADVVLTLLGLYLFASLGKEIIPPRSVAIYVVFAAIVFILTIVVGGFDIAYPPQFVFEYSEAEKGVRVYYSQGVSKFFALTAIGAIFLVFSSEKWTIRVALVCVCIASLALSLLGGARADSVAAALIVFAYSCAKAPASIWFWAATVVLAVVLFQGTVVVDDFLIFNRLMNLQDDVGIRERLLLDSLTLLSEEPACLIVGCGFGFFQAYYEYETGLYPHNFVVESIIVWGLPLVLAAALFALAGLRVYVRRAREGTDAFLLYYAYFVFIFLKSGTVLGAWFVMAASLYFVALGLETVLPARRITAGQRRLKAPDVRYSSVNGTPQC